MSIVKIGLVGAESSGKTTLAQALANHLQAPMVLEQAREYLRHTPQYTQADLLHIAQAQQQAEKQAKQAIQPARAYLIADTTLLVIRIWSLYRFGSLSAPLAQACANESYHVYVLCHYDIPWQADPLREHASGVHRCAIHALYQAYLLRYNLPVVCVRGNTQERLKQVCQYLAQMV